MTFEFKTKDEFDKFENYIYEKLKEYSINKEDYLKRISLYYRVNPDIKDLLLYLEEKGKKDIINKIIDIGEIILLKNLVYNYINFLYSVNINKEKVNNLINITKIIDINLLDMYYKIIDNESNIDENIENIKKFGSEAKILLEELLKNES